MPEPAFLVEGQMEQLILQHICPGKTVRRIGCNGDAVSMEAVARALTVHRRLLKTCCPVVILLDRERRQQDCAALRSELSRILDGGGYGGRYVVAFADRTIENWILADWDNIRSCQPHFRELQGQSEGCHGKAVIRRLMPKGTIYHETTIGVSLFKLCRPTELYRRSNSFRDLVDELDFDCWWLNQIEHEVPPYV